MGKLFNGILKFLAAICAVIFVLSLGVSLLLFNAQRRLFDSRLYLDALETQNIYERLPALMTESMNGNGSTALPAYLKALPIAEREQIIRTVIPPEITKSMAEQAITSVFDTLNGKSDSAVLSLAELKSYLGGPAGAEAILKLLATQPNCTFDQLAEMTAASLFGTQGRLYLCNLPDEYANQLGGNVFKQLIGSALQTVAQGLPDEVTLLSSGNSRQAILISRLRIAHTIMRFSLLIPLGLLFFITIFAVRSWKDWLNWWGIPLLLGGLFSLAIAGAVNPLLNWAFKTFAVTRLPSSMPVSLAEAIRELISAVMTGVTTPIAIQSVLLLLTGAIMLLATRYRKPTKPASQPHDRIGETPEEKAPSTPAS